jgi:hypothetical protein
MQYFRLVGDWVSEKAQFDKNVRSLFQIELVWSPGLDMASRLIYRSAGFMKVCVFGHNSLYIKKYGNLQNKQYKFHNSRGKRNRFKHAYTRYSKNHFASKNLMYFLQNPFIK